MVGGDEGKVVFQIKYTMCLYFVNYYNQLRIIYDIE